MKKVFVFLSVVLATFISGLLAVNMKSNAMHEALWSVESQCVELDQESLCSVENLVDKYGSVTDDFVLSANIKGMLLQPNLGLSEMQVEVLKAYESMLAYDEMFLFYLMLVFVASLIAAYGITKVISKKARVGAPNNA